MKLIKTITNYITKLTLIAFLNITTLSITTVRALYKIKNWKGDWYTKYDKETFIIISILTIILIVTTTINFIIELKNSTKQ